MSSVPFLAPLLTSGGDRRIHVARGSNVNVYGASPFPRAMLAYASSTANDISLGAFARLEDFVSRLPAGALQDAAHYCAELECVRLRLRRAFMLEDDVDIVFAPSGTDLEYVPLAMAVASSGKDVTNILLGPDEVGSGCALACGGRYFADETAIISNARRGDSLAGFGEVEVTSLPIRDDEGRPCSSAETTTAIIQVCEQAIRQGRKILVHVVHGSKTGLALPALADIDSLRGMFGAHLDLVVDACQARLEPATVRKYLQSGCTVLLTGSKFVGGPPFSGFALVPGLARPTTPLPPGLATVFRRGEWPAQWRACDFLPASANPGLLLRLLAAVFEIERFACLSLADRDRVVVRFGEAVHGLKDRLGAALVGPSLGSGSLRLSTLATLDLTPLPGNPNFATAQRWQRILAARGIRLGQPVRCVRTADGDWGATLRMSLSMPSIADLAALEEAALASRLAHDMTCVAEVLEAAARPVVA